MEETSIPSHFDKTKFQRVIRLCGIKVNNKQINEVLSGVKDQFLEMTNTKRVVPVADDPNSKLLLLAECLQKDTFETKWPDALKNKVKAHSLELVNYDLNVSFDNLSVSQILEQLIPAEIGAPSGYETVGHIAHFNLKANQIPYQHLIGEVIIEKFKQIKTVVNKCDKLHNVYRTPELSLMAGENNLDTEHKEDKCLLKLNFEKVYFCARLQNERDRILQLFKQNQTVLDLFCGVGPLAIRAGKMGCNVIANDLNPHCYDYLLLNREKNDVEHKVLCMNNDARKIVDLMISEEAITKYTTPYHHFDHVYMNLPVDNIEFCDVFKGFLRKANPSIWNETNLPMIHATGFVSAEGDAACKEVIAQRAKLVLPHFKAEHILHFNIIKNVTASKKMFCISFKLSVEDAKEEPSTYSYITPERETESLPVLRCFGKEPVKKLKKE